MITSTRTTKINITKTGKINATLNTTIVTKTIGAIMINAMLRIIITIIGTLGTGTMGAIGTMA